MLFKVVLVSYVDFYEGSIRCDRETDFLHASDPKKGFDNIFGGLHVIRFTSLDVDFSPN